MTAIPRLRSVAAAAALVLAGTAHAAGWTVTDLGRFEGSTIALNDQGWVVNGAHLLTPGAAGYTRTTLLNALGDTSNFGLRDVNNAGVVLGYDASAGFGHGFTWRNGVRTDLPETPDWQGYRYSRVGAINDGGQVVGNSGDTAQVWTPLPGGGWRMTALGVDLGWTIGSGDGVAINADGAGLMAQVYNSYQAGWSLGVGTTQIAPAPAGYTLIGQGLNDAYTVVGQGFYNCQGYGCTHPFVWQAGRVDLLPVPVVGGFGITGDAYAVNERNQIVGGAYVAPYVRNAFLWTAGAGGWTATDLDTLLPAGSPFYHLGNAMDINERGQIVGAGSVAGDWQVHAFLLTPVPEPQAWALLLAGVAVLGWRARRAGAA